MIKRFPLLLLVLIICLNLVCSCKEELLPCKEILERMINAETELTAGKIYDLSAAVGDERFISDDMLCALYGDIGVNKIKDSWIDGALFLSLTDSPCEFAVFYCDSRDTATDTAALLCSRLSSIRTAKAQDKYKPMLSSAKVTVCGNYAFLIISRDCDNALKVAEDAL